LAARKAARHIRVEVGDVDIRSSPDLANQLPPRHLSTSRHAVLATSRRSLECLFQEWTPSPTYWSACDLMAMPRRAGRPLQLARMSNSTRTVSARRCPDRTLEKLLSARSMRVRTQWRELLAVKTPVRPFEKAELPASQSQLFLAPPHGCASVRCFSGDRSPGRASKSATLFALNMAGSRVAVGKRQWRLQRHDGVTTGVKKSAILLLALPRGCSAAFVSDVAAMPTRTLVVDLVGGQR